MAKGNERDPRKEAFWRKELRTQGASGQSARVYCRQRGLMESAFYFWRREIERRDRETRDRRTSAFVPMVVEPTPETPIEVTLCRGHVMRVRAGFDADTLRQLLALLEEPSC
jgi:transposase